MQETPCIQKCSDVTLILNMQLPATTRLPCNICAFFCIQNTNDGNIVLCVNQTPDHNYEKNKKEFSNEFLIWQNN